MFYSSKRHLGQRVELHLFPNALPAGRHKQGLEVTESHISRQERMMTIPLISDKRLTCKSIFSGLWKYLTISLMATVWLYLCNIKICEESILVLVFHFITIGSDTTMHALQRQITNVSLQYLKKIRNSRKWH